MEHLIGTVKGAADMPLIKNILIGIAGGFVSFMMQEEDKGWKIFVKVLAIAVFTTVLIAPLLVSVAASMTSQWIPADVMVSVDNFVVALSALGSQQLLHVLRRKFIKKVDNFEDK
jgi:hypothetical protein